MGAKSILISEGVYARLEAEKGEGESFNDVLNRLTKKGSLLNIVGFLKVEKKYVNKKRWQKRKE